MIRLRFLLVALAVFAPQTVAAQPTDEVHYYHLDAIGSVRMVTDANGQVFARHDYQPFGQEWPDATGSNTRRFAGKEFDAETDYDYFGGRFYRSASGRFTSVDPELGIETALTDPQRWNRYSYVGNRPTRIIDPDGRGWASALFKIGKAVVKGTNIASEAAGVISDVKTVADGDASWLARGIAVGSLASEVFLPISGRDAAGIVSFVRGGINPVRLGEAGEAAVRAVAEIGSKVKIAINGRDRIPDGLTRTVLTEIKNVAELSYTQQLRDFAEFARQTGRTFELYVRPDTRLSAPLLGAVRAGEVTIKYIKLQ